MYSCYSFGAHLNIDGISKNILEEYESIIVGTTQTWSQTQSVIAAINNGKFTRWLMEQPELIPEADKKDFNLFKYNPTKSGFTNKIDFKKWVNRYVKQISKNVYCTSTHNTGENLDGFLDPTVKALALEYSADLLIEEYYKAKGINAALDLNGKLTATNIVNSVADNIFNNFLDAVQTLITIYPSLDKENSLSKAIDEINSSIQNRNNAVAKRSTLQEEFNALKKERSEYRKSFYDIEENKGKDVTKEDKDKELTDKINDVKKQYNEINSSLDKSLFKDVHEKQNAAVILAKKILDENKVKNYELTNYGTLANNIAVNKQKWIKETLELSKLLDLRKAFDEVADPKKVDDSSYEDDMDLTEILSTELDETLDKTDSWSDQLYKNYIKHFNGRLTLYLNSLSVLNSTAKIKKQNSDGKIIEDYDYNTDNALGVSTKMNYKNIISNIVEFCSFNTVDEFIGSVEVLANKIPSMHGLIKLVDDMREDRVFANFVAVNFGKARVYKNMVTIANSDITVAQSNREAYQKTQLFNALLNNGRITLEGQYDIKDIDTINSLLYDLKRTSKLTDSENSELLTKSANFIINYLNKMFPNLDTRIFDSYFFGISNNKNQDAVVILNALKDFDSKINGIRDDISREHKRVYEINRNIERQKEIAFEQGMPLPTKQFEIFNPENVNYKSLNEPIGRLTNIFYQLQDAHINLNSTTATGSLASDIVKSSWVTNLQKQLDDIVFDEKDPNKITYRGIEILKEFYDRRGQGKGRSDNYFSTMLWGVINPHYGVDGDTKQYLKEGLFIRTASGATMVNPNARNIIKISLFSGIKNRDIDSGVPYEKMSKGDYFISGLYLYHRPGSTFERYITEDEAKEYGNIMLRIPSDASNNYMAQVSKLKIDGLYTLAPEDFNKFQTYKDNTFGAVKYNDKINNFDAGKEFGQNIGSRTNTIAKTINTVFKDKANVVSLDRAMRILHDGGITSLNVNRYQSYVNNNNPNVVVVPIVCESSQGKFLIWLAGEGNKRSAKNLSIISITSAEFIGDRKEMPKIYEDAPEEEYTKQKAAQNAWFKKEENWKPTSLLLNAAIADAEQTVLDYAFKDNAVNKAYNKNHVLYQSLRQEFLGSFNSFVNALDDVFEETPEGYKVKDNLKGLFVDYHYKDNSILKKVKDNDNKEHLELSGNAFNFSKLFYIESDDKTVVYDAKKELLSQLSLYGGQDSVFIEKNGSLYLNPDAKIKLFDRTNLGFAKVINLNVPAINDILDNVMTKWLSAYERYIINMSEAYENILEDTFSESQIKEAILNQTVYYMQFDDILESSSDFYKDAQTFLKRDKEVQMGGTPYSGSIDYRDQMGAAVKALKDSQGNKLYIPLKRKVKDNDVYEEVSLPQFDATEENKEAIVSSLVARNGWRAVTIKNTKTYYEGGKYIYDSIKEKILKETGDNTLAEKTAKDIAKGYGYIVNDDGSVTHEHITKANDAQSFVTLEEWIRRRWADGTLGEYGYLPYKLLKGEHLTAEDYEGVKKIQISKNVYYDIQYDAATGLHYGRQIKNAELVLIPALLEEGSSFKKLYDLMHKYDIGQVNTLETSKAANHNVLEFWDANNAKDENGNVILHEEDFENAIKDDTNVETFYYKYLYKQQDFLDHLVDAENKAGIQFVKKLIDNASTIIKENNDNINSEALNAEFLSKVTIDHYEREGQIIDSVDKGRNICLTTQMICMGAVADAFNNGDMAHNVKSFPISISAKSPLSDEIIEHHTVLVKINGEPFIFDMPQTEFITKTGNKFTEKGQEFDEGKIGEYKPYLIHVTKENLANKYGVSGKELDMDYNHIKDLLSRTSGIGGGLNIELTVKETKENKVSKKTVQDLVNDFQRIFSINIKESFDDLLIELDWKVNDNGEVVNKKDGSTNLDFTRFAEKFKTEAIRLNSDSNFLDYCTLDDFGGFIMPNAMNNVSSKLEAIAQSIFNSAITRQTLPGFHSIETTGVGYMYEDVNTGEKRELRYRPEVNGKRLPVVECASPAWSDDIKQLVAKYGKKEALKILQKEGLDEFIGYRIPTEGKQSMVIFRCVDILDDVQGSKMIVANDWITQTGADNDGDSIYTWTQITKYNKKLGTIKKLKSDYDAVNLYYNYVMSKLKIYSERFKDAVDDNEQKGLRLLKQAIKDADKKEANTEQEKKNKKDHILRLLNNISKKCGFLTYEDFNKLSDESRLPRDVRNNMLFDVAYKLLSNPKFSDEETFTRSQFEEITKYNAENRGILGLSKKSRSTYNPFDQLDFMQNAIDGRGLKAISVNRDTGCSLCNKAKALLSEGNEIVVEYDLNEYNETTIKQAYGEENVVIEGNIARVTHNRIGWSNTNRNVVGKLITAYSSQTTAHILDAIKEGALYNETNYTFGTFKTLIDVGIDYDTAIAFLMQPAITELNNDYFRTNSVFSKTYNDPINNVIRAWAIRNNIKVNNDFVNDFTPIKDILKAIRANSIIKTEYFNQFGIDLNNSKKVPALNKIKLKERLRQKANNIENLSTEVFDLGMILAFSKFYNTTQAYENNLKVTRPDSFGAKQTVRETRRIVSDAISYAKGIDNNQETDGLAIIVKGEDGKTKPLIDALYPGLKDDSNNNSINIKESVYPSLASFFKYATQMSVASSKKLFITESDGFYKFTNDFEKAIGRRLTTDEAKKFKKYIVSSIYQSIPILFKPIIINEYNQFTEDSDRMKENPINYWDTEVSRIGGYIEKAGDYFVAKDPFNPTDDELKQFNKLTPLQKVVYIKQTFTDGAGIFAFINTVKAYGKEIKEQGFSKNRLTVDIDNANIENLFIEFKKCFFNSNKLVKLAALDLIKYAFVVEGFDFRKGTITKIIANESLLREINKGGTGIIDVFKEKLFSLFGNFQDTTYKMTEDTKEGFFDEFIRANSEMIKTVRLPKPNPKSKEFNPSSVFIDREIKYKQNDTEFDIGMYYIPNDENSENTALIEKLCKFVKDEENGYRNIGYYKNGKYITTLFKIHPIVVQDKILGYYLIPLNKLEKFEHGEWSKNNDNNKYYGIPFYNKIIDNNQCGVLDYSISDLGNIKEYEAPIYKKTTTSDLSNPDLLIQTVENENADPKDIAVAKDIINKIATWYETKQPSDVLGYIQNTSKQFNRLTGFKFDGTSTLVNIPTKNGIITVELIKEKTGVFYKYHQKQKLGYYYDNKGNKTTANIALTNSQKEFYDNMQYHSDVGSSYEGVYVVKTVINEKENASIIESAKEKVDNFDKENASRYEAPNRWHQTRLNSFDTLSKIANLIAEEFKVQDRKNNTKAHNALTTLSQIGVSFDTMANINKGKESIYKVAADYYEETAKEILDELSNFKIDNVYSVDDDALYDSLRNHPEYASKLYNLILRAKIFGRELNVLTKLHISGEDTETTLAAKRIIDAINSVRSNTKVQAAIDHIYNSYLAYEYSTNPNIKMGIVDLTTAFGDTDFFDTWIGDILNINHKQIQLIVKLANDELNKAKMDAINAIDKFDDWWNEQISKYGEQGFKDLLNVGIDENGKFIRPFNEQFLEDKNKLLEELNSAKEKYGVFSIQYQKANLAYAEFKANYMQQPIKNEYYKKNVANRKEVLRDAPDLYIKYIELQDKLHNKYGDIENLTDDELKERQDILNQLADIKSEYNRDGSSKTKEQIDKTRALAKYLKTSIQIENEFKEEVVSQEYKDNIDKYKGIIEDYKEKNPDKTLIEIYNENPDSDFTKAYDWIRNNASFGLSKEGWDLIQEQYDKIFKIDDIVRNAVSSIIKFHDGDVYDIYGNIVGDRFSNEEQEKIKEITQLSYNPFKGVDENGHLVLTPESSLYTQGSDTMLVKEIPEGPILTKEFYETFFKGDTPESLLADKYKQYAIINKLIIKGFDENGHLSPKRLKENLTDKELQELSDAYNAVRDLNKTQAKLNKNKKKNEDADKVFNYETVLLSPDVLSELNSYGGITRQLLIDIFYDFSSDGSIEYENGIPLGNKLIYGYIDMKKDKTGEYTPEAKKYIDFKKTEANKWLADNVEDDVTPYYKQAKAKAEAEGDTEWFARNHVWNPYKHDWEPTKIWKVRRATPEGVLAKEYDFIPNPNNTTKTVKADQVNEFYEEGGINYKRNSKYDNPIFYGLSEDELKTIDYLRDMSAAYASSYSAKQFVKNGYAPRSYKTNADAKWWAEQIASSLGFKPKTYTYGQWHEHLENSYNTDIPINMYSLLKGKGYKKMLKLPSRIDFPVGPSGDVAYEAKLNEVKEANKKIAKNNLEIDNAILDRDWKSVYRKLIQLGYENQAKNSMKDLLYLTLEDLRTRESIETSDLYANAEKVVRSLKRSKPDSNEVNTYLNENTSKIFENYIRRYLFGEFHKPNSKRRMADSIQSFVSAKYMIGNIRGGFANIGTGLVNMFGESFAQTHFTKKELKAGVTEYLTNLYPLLASFATDDTPNKTVGIINFFDVVDTDDYSEVARGDKKADASKAAEKINSILYGANGAGEHFMQNASLLAMTKSHRVFVDPATGKATIGTLNDYTRMIDIASFKQVLELNKDNNNGIDGAMLLYLFENSFLKNIKNDAEAQRKYDRFNRDIVTDFIRSAYVPSEIRRKLAKEYIELRKKNYETDKEEFFKNDTLESRLGFDKEHRHITIINNPDKPELNLTTRQLAEFKGKVLEVNKIIHGVYDKMGAAMLEKLWFGSLVMQYHKHMFPGYMKRWRKKGFWNETIGFQEYGSQAIIYELLQKDVTYGSRFDQGSKNPENEVQERGLLKSIASWIVLTIGSIADISINYQMLPMWQQQIMKKRLGDFAGIGAGLLTTMAIYAMIGDDDRYKDNKYIATLLYLADRLFTESRMYNIMGAISEFRTLWSSPVACWTTGQDLVKAIEYVGKGLFDSNFDWTVDAGKNKGRNKLGVLITRNTPIYRIYERFQQAAQNNNYYRIGDQMNAITLFKRYGIYIHPYIHGE